MGDVPMAAGLHIEPPQVSWRLFCLSQAATGTSWKNGWYGLWGGQVTRNQQIHLFQKFTHARSLSDQLESGAGKAHLFHGSTVS
jgi:hypothetical protein